MAIRCSWRARGVRRFAACSAALAIAGVALTPSAAVAQSARQIPSLTLEDLLHIEVQQVFGASERLQPVTEAPASVTIITADDITRYGYRTLAEILQGVRDFYVSNDRNYSYVGTRGVAISGDYNTRVLLMVNGHRVNDAVYDQALVGNELGMDPAVFERVEVIRGPGSSLYGTSAFFAVVNVITRPGASIDGGSLTAEDGTLGTRLLRGSAGRRFANGADVAWSGTWYGSDGQRRLYFPALDTPATNGGIAEGLDGEAMRSLYGQFSFKALTVTGSYGRRRKDVPTASFGTLFNEQRTREQTLDRRALVDAQYDVRRGTTHVNVRASFDRYAYDGLYPFAGADARSILVNDDSAVGVRWSAEGRVTRALPARQMLTVGAELVDNLRQDQTSLYSDPSRPGFSVPQRSRQRAVYAQDEIKLSRWALVNGGVRVDDYSRFTRVSPRAALVVTTSPQESFKYLFGTAFRAPNAYELNYFTEGPDLSLRPETIATHELVWERYTGRWLRTSASTYWSDIDALLSLHADPATLALSFANEARMRTQGLGLEAEARLKGGLQGQAGYSLQRAVSQDTHEPIANSPRHLVKLRVSVPGPRAGSSASVETQYVGRRATIAGTTLAPAFFTNVTVTLPVGQSLQLVATARDLFDNRYEDPASDEHVMDGIPQVGRTLRGGVRWSFWRR